MVRLSSRLLTLSLLSSKVCLENLLYKETVTIGVDALQCKKYGNQEAISLYTAQSSDRTFQFEDVNELVDFSAATAITFGVWDSVATGSTQRIAKSLGSGITTPSDNIITVVVDDTDSTIPATKYYFELWVEAEGVRTLLSFGDFYLTDTRNYD